jgi:putative hydrolase of the HAD superfamily
MKKKEKIIVFDLGNTVIKFDHGISAAKISGLFDMDQKKIYDTFFDSEITRAFDRGRLSPEEFHEALSSHLGIKLAYEEFSNIWSDIFWADESVCGLVRELKDRKYKLFLLSNINRLHFEYIEKKFDIIQAFDELILSYIVGAIKPELPIFEAVIEKSGGDKSVILYIDDREDLIKEAAALGIDSIRFEGADKLREKMKSLNIIA